LKSRLGTEAEPKGTEEPRLGTKPEDPKNREPKLGSTEPKPRTEGNLSTEPKLETKAWKRRRTEEPEEPKNREPRNRNPKPGTDRELKQNPI